MNEDTYADDQYEREREIRHLGAGSGWACQAQDDATADLPDASLAWDQDDPAYRVL